ncbi:MAG: dynamin family protein [Ignavibacteriaceae bacterium]|nr:dynamin family protein [Ignavibacteriaceae bacterium]
MEYIFSAIIIGIIIWLIFYTRNKRSSQGTERKENKQQSNPLIEVKKNKKTSFEVIVKSLSSAIIKLELEKEKTKELLGTIESLIESYKSPLLVTVLGEFSSGKSTFINALLREKLLAMKQRETTATITKLQFGKIKKLSVHFKDNTIKTLELNDNVRNMDEFVVENDENAILDKVKYVTVELNNKLLEHIDLADTPGFNSSYNRHTDITKDFIRYSDLVIWLFDARKMGKASEFKIISDHCKYFKPVGIVNWVNKLPLKEGESAEQHLKAKLIQYQPMFEKFFLISALDGLNAIDGEYKKSGMADIVDYFTNVIIPGGTQLKNKAIMKRLRIIGNDLVGEQNVLIKQKEKIKYFVDNFKNMVTQRDKGLENFNSSIKNWNNDCKGQDNYNIIKNIDHYFIGNNVPTNIGNSKDKFVNKIDILECRSDDLDNTLNKIEIKRIKLSDEVKNCEQMIEDYQHNHPFKAVGDQISEYLFGKSLSAEKIAINNSIDAYSEHENKFNAKVNKYNRDLKMLEDDKDEFEDTIIHFLNNVALPAINNQSEQFLKLSDKIESQREDMKRLELDVKKVDYKLKIINSEIVNDYRDLLQIIIREKSISNDGMDLTAVLNQIDSTTDQNANLDWSRIYSRIKMDKIITQKVSSSIKSDVKEIETEDRIIEKIR